MEDKLCYRFITERKIDAVYAGISHKVMSSVIQIVYS